MGEEETPAGIAEPEHHDESEAELRERLDRELEVFSDLKKQQEQRPGDTSLADAVEAKRAELVELTKRLPYHPEREDPAFVEEVEGELEDDWLAGEKRRSIRQQEGADEAVAEAERRREERETRGEPLPAAHEQDEAILEPILRYVEEQRQIEEQRQREENEKKQQGQTPAPEAPMTGQDLRAQGLSVAFGGQPTSGFQRGGIPSRESPVDESEKEEIHELQEKILDTLISMDGLYDGIVDASEAVLDPRGRNEICESARLFVEGSWGLATSTIGVQAADMKNLDSWPPRPKKLLQQLRVDLEARWDRLSETAARLNRESGFDEPEDS